MYRLVGLVDNVGALLERVPSLIPVGERGSGCLITDRNKTRDLYQPLLPQLPGRWDIAFVVIMPVNCHLPVHIDRMENPLRHVVVLKTNPACACYHDGSWQHLETGGIYQMDASKPHGSVNLGPEPRIHLSIDVW